MFRFDIKYHFTKSLFIPLDVSFKWLSLYFKEESLRQGNRKSSPTKNLSQTQSALQRARRWFWSRCDFSFMWTDYSIVRSMFCFNVKTPTFLMHTDESTRKSCFILLLLCLVTVVISMGWTALYCLVAEANSNACVDFSQNVDFYFGPVRRGVDTITQWFSSSAS